MSTQVKERPTHTGGHHDDEAMVHWCEPPYTHGICGALLVGIDVPDGTPIDCVVCAEIEGSS